MFGSASNPHLAEELKVKGKETTPGSGVRHSPRYQERQNGVYTAYTWSGDRAVEGPGKANSVYLILGGHTPLALTQEYQGPGNAQEIASGAPGVLHVRLYTPADAYCTLLAYLFGPSTIPGEMRKFDPFFNVIGFPVSHRPSNLSDFIGLETNGKKIVIETSGPYRGMLATKRGPTATMLLVAPPPAVESPSVWPRPSDSPRNGRGGGNTTSDGSSSDGDDGDRRGSKGINPEEKSVKGGHAKEDDSNGDRRNPTPPKSAADSYLAFVLEAKSKAIEREDYDEAKRLKALECKVTSLDKTILRLISEKTHCIEI